MLLLVPVGIDQIGAGIGQLGKRVAADKMIAVTKVAVERVVVNKAGANMVAAGTVAGN